ncbi:hypothetical protein [Mitsuaria sp. GD03876]|uniref:hypothetical protein n=1 Tax=Mitsuaria sp. GD03876 TaxID=2975399 RepID=UPI002446BA67|nr:hypothetical protein [Mitsuaria sp. GD03876]MDH0863616.1 hypothetical protein [Mitsuaria sp. GD03876]
MEVDFDRIGQPTALPKTSLIAGLYDLFQLGQVGNVAFAQSFSLHAFARALGRGSRSVGELLQMTLEPLHTAVSDSTLSDDDWGLIELRLSWVSEDKRWDRLGRLRNAVAGAYLDRHLWPRGFASIAADNNVFVALMEQTVDRWGGKRFLKTVEESLEQEADAFWRARRELIHWFLKRK